MSLVLVCPSTEMQLNESSTASERIGWRSLGQTGASVSRNASIVAIRGPIIAAPLARPRSETARPVPRCSSETTLGGCRSSGSPGRRRGSRRLGARAGRLARRSPASEPVHRELVADHAGRGDEDLLRPGSRAARAASARPSARRSPAPARRSPRWRCPR